jgi:hypothetical protein
MRGVRNGVIDMERVRLVIYSILHRRKLEEILNLTNGIGTFYYEYMVTRIAKHPNRDIKMSEALHMDLDTRASFMDLAISAYQAAGFTNQKASLPSLIYWKTIEAINNLMMCGGHTKNWKRKGRYRQNEMSISSLFMAVAWPARNET